jgi:hypothetical protein
MTELTLGYLENKFFPLFLFVLFSFLGILNFSPKNRKKGEIALFSVNGQKDIAKLKHLKV